MILLVLLLAPVAVVVVLASVVVSSPEPSLVVVIVVSLVVSLVSLLSLVMVLVTIIVVLVVGLFELVLLGLLSLFMLLFVLVVSRGSLVFLLRFLSLWLLVVVSLLVLLLLVLPFVILLSPLLFLFVVLLSLRVPVLLVMFILGMSFTWFVLHLVFLVLFMGVVVPSIIVVTPVILVSIKPSSSVSELLLSVWLRLIPVLVLGLLVRVVALIGVGGVFGVELLVVVVGVSLLEPSSVVSPVNSLIGILWSEVVILIIRPLRMMFFGVIISFLVVFSLFSVLWMKVVVLVLVLEGLVHDTISIKVFPRSLHHFLFLGNPFLLHDKLDVVPRVLRGHEADLQRALVPVELLLVSLGRSSKNLDLENGGLAQDFKGTSVVGVFGTKVLVVLYCVQKIDLVKALDLPLEQLGGEDGLVHVLGHGHDLHEGILLVVYQVDAEGNTLLDICLVRNVDFVLALALILLLDVAHPVLVLLVLEVRRNLFAHLFYIYFILGDRTLIIIHFIHQL